jgi:citrate synthase
MQSKNDDDAQGGGMQIGKSGKAATSISSAEADSITVRDKDLCADLMGRIGFTDYFFLLVTGSEPTERQRFFLDLLLVSIAEHGLVPTNQVARMTYDADMSFLQGAVAAGLLGCGSVVLGTSELCGQFLFETKKRIDTAKDEPEAVLRAAVSEIKDAGEKVPGFGHPIHKPLDPRTERIFSLADEKGAAGPYTALARQTRDAVHEVWDRPLTMNVSMAIAAILLDLDFPAAMIKAIPILARTASLLAHLAEEREQPIGFLMAHHGEEAISYVPQGDG